MDNAKACINNKMRKILILDSLYPEMIKVKNETKNKLESEFFGTGKMYQYYLEKIGYKVEVEYFNYPKNFKNEKINRYIDYFSLTFGRLPKHLTFLQKYTKTFRRVRTTINIFEPDVILIQDLNYLNDFSVKYLKNRGIRIIGEIASPLPPTRMLINYDLILSSLPNIVSRIQTHNIKSEILPLGFDPRINDILGIQIKKYDIIFIGSFSKVHKNTIKIVKEIAKNFPSFKFFGPIQKRILIRHNLMPYYGGQAWGINMYRILSQSKIVINRHSEISDNYANNLRLYEVTGVGSVLITENKKNIEELFKVDTEIITYDNMENLILKIRTTLENTEKIKSLSVNAKKRTISEYNYEERMKQLSKIIDRI